MRIAASETLKVGPPLVELGNALPDANAKGAFSLSLDQDMLRREPGKLGE